MMINGDLMGRITETHVAVWLLLLIFYIYDNGERWRRNKYSSDFDAWTY